MVQRGDLGPGEAAGDREHPRAGRIHGWPRDLRRPSGPGRAGPQHRPASGVGVAEDGPLDSLRSLAPEGRLLVIGFTGGEIPTVKVNRLLLNNVSVVGVGWGAFLMVDPGYLQQQWTEVRALVEAGSYTPISPDVHELADGPAVLASMADRSLVGKAVLRLREG